MTYKRSLAVMLSATVMALTTTVAHANNPIVATIENAKSGQTVNVSGTYSGITTRIQVPSGVTVQGPATFVFTTGTSADGFYVPSGNSGVKLNSLTVQGANHGIMIYGSSCTVNSCIAEYNYNTGIEIIGSSAKNNVIKYSQGKYNADPGGGNADGITVKFSSGSGNQILHCDAHGNSDDGYDYAGAGAPVLTSGCSSYNNGYYNGQKGNGCGFKMGLSGYPNESHTYTSCTAYNNTAGDTGSGFDSNNNYGPIYLNYCHSYGNKQADRLQNVVLNNCTMQN
ncbi:MAG TPA: hypothetical protein VFV23_01925 [Verrucomicrobiae bacterium]|nr:hypothetical protein [Verrucomicrobiae bacterium]